jgi:hypothetical protein
MLIAFSIVFSPCIFAYLGVIFEISFRKLIVYCVSKTGFCQTKKALSELIDILTFLRILECRSVLLKGFLLRGGKVFRGLGK